MRPGFDTKQPGRIRRGKSRAEEKEYLGLASVRRASLRHVGQQKPVVWEAFSECLATTKTGHRISLREKTKQKITFWSSGHV
jgi:hypothetical protein